LGGPDIFERLGYLEHPEYLFYLTSLVQLHFSLDLYGVRISATFVGTFSR